MMPVYEAKMIHQYDHRWATYEGSMIRDVTESEKRLAPFVAFPQYWVNFDHIAGSFRGPTPKWFLGFRDIARATDERTTICSIFPISGVGNKLPLLTSNNPNYWSVMLALNSYVHDFASRQKVGGTSLNFFLVKQFPVPSPSVFNFRPPWTGSMTIHNWLFERFFELVFTANEMSRLSKHFEADGHPFVWDAARRELLRAEIDAAFFHLYGVNRADAEYILGTFPIVKRKDEAAHGEYRTQRLILEIYEAIELAMQTGAAYQTNLDPPPGHGARHTAQEAVR